MEQSILEIGIDIGWSERQRSCAFAAHDPLHTLPWPERATFYDSAAVGCCRFRFSELIAFLNLVRREMDNYEQTVVILDGPLGPVSRPHTNREVDSSFRKGAFRNRTQPADIDNELGRTYVNATYQAVAALCDDFSPWTSGDVGGSLVVAETNPTVGLALLNPKFDPDKLPSRKRPLVPPNSERTERAVRAKSDFYWRVGGRRHCASILGSPAIVTELNHENVAGLYCLAVARSLADGNIISCGNVQTGVYVFPNRIDSEWIRDLGTAGVVFGEPMELEKSSIIDRLASWSRATTESVIRPADFPEDRCLEINEQEELQFRGDLEILLLNDNGGVWDKHNDWLEGVDGPVRIRSISRGIEASLHRAKNANQWTSNPTALSFARSHGYPHAHLSSECSLAIEVEILEVLH